LPERPTVTSKEPTFSTTEMLVALNLNATFLGAADAAAGTTATTNRAQNKARERVGMLATSAPTCRALNLARKARPWSTTPGGCHGFGPNRQRVARARVFNTPTVA
jgi:hypothetical protein